jgi:hypothetical protein
MPPKCAATVDRHIAQIEAGFLSDLATQCSFGLFAEFEKSTGQTPTRKRPENVIEQEYLTFFIYNDSGDGSREFAL